MVIDRIRGYCHSRLEQAVRPLAQALLQLKVVPNQVSLAGALLSLAAAALIATDNWLLAGLVYLTAGLLDLLDGVLARLGRMATRFGAFLDSTLDRISEGLVFSAIAYAFARQGLPLEASLAVLALLGSLLVSYTRARAEALGAECKVGLMTRAERVVLLTLGLLLGLLSEAVLVLAVLTAVTVGQRIGHTWRELGPQG